MKIIAAAIIASIAGSSAAFALDPIQGSITQGGANVQIEKAPAGSTFFHTFYANGSEVREVYKVNADHSVSLVNRTIAND